MTERRAIVSADSDVSTLLGLTGEIARSLVQLRSGDQLGLCAQAVPLLANLPSLDINFRHGVVVSLSASLHHWSHDARPAEGQACRPPREQREW